MASRRVITCDDLESKLKQVFSAERVEVVDLSDGCGSKFSAMIVSSSFEGMAFVGDKQYALSLTAERYFVQIIAGMSGKNLLTRHREVNAALSEEMKQIHALTLKTWTPSQYQSKLAAQSSHES